MTPAWGQPAIAVQLPTFSFFSTSTTVSVPDRGSAYLGGVNRAQSGLRESGVPLLPSAPFRNRASSSGASASGAGVSVYIHDFRAMDEYLLGQASAGQGAVSRDAVAGAKRSAPQGAAAPSRGLALSPAEIARQRPVAPVDPHQEAENLYNLGLEAQAQGNLGAARVFYEMAARRATGQLRERILDRLQVVSPSRHAPR